jgi:hypothetical protein
VKYYYNVKDEVLVRVERDSKYFYWKKYAWFMASIDQLLPEEHLIPDSAVLLSGVPIYD